MLSIIEAIIEYINYYAFSIVAIYGKPFTDSATQAWELMKSKGFDAIINDSLVDGVCGMICLISALINGILTALLAHYVWESDWRVWCVIGVVAGYLLTLLACVVIESTVTTLFICLAFDPQAMAANKPQHYATLVNTFNGYGYNTFAQGP